MSAPKIDHDARVMCEHCACNRAATRLGLAVCVVCAGIVTAPRETPAEQWYAIRCQPLSKGSKR